MGNMTGSFQIWKKLSNFERKFTNSIKNLIIFFQILEPLLKRPKADKGGYYIFDSILIKNELQIGRRSIKGDLIFLFYLFSEWATNRPKADKERYYIFDFILLKKWAPNRPKADKGGYYIIYLILLKNEPQIGRRPIKGGFMSFNEFFEILAPNRPKGILCFKSIFVEIWAKKSAKFSRNLKKIQKFFDLKWQVKNLS